MAFVAGDYGVRWHKTADPAGTFTTAKVTFGPRVASDQEKLEACLQLAISAVAPGGPGLLDEIQIGKIVNPVGPTWDVLLLIGAP